MVTADFHYVSDNKSLAQWCQTLGQKPWVALDTEFARFNTYYQIVGLVQLSDGQSHVLIDPMGIEQWQPLVDLLSNPCVTKILHASGEDLELLQHWLDVVPTPLFDTQVAAAFAGLGASIGLQALVSQLLDIHIDKEETRSDWLQRPLTDAQLSYAALDVAYLLACREHLSQALDANNKTQWFDQDMQQLAKKKPPTLPEHVYLKVKGAWQLKGQALQRLQALAQWRECTARTDNMPKGFILKDLQLIQLASHTSMNKTKLCSIKDIHPRIMRRYADDIVALFVQCDQAMDNVCDDASFVNELSTNNYTATVIQTPIAPISKQEQPQFKALQKVVRDVAQAHQLEPQIVARKAQLLEIFDHARRGLCDAHYQYFVGWRGEILTQPMAQALSEIHHAR